MQARLVDTELAENLGLKDTLQKIRAIEWSFLDLLRPLTGAKFNSLYYRFLLTWA